MSNAKGGNKHRKGKKNGDVLRSNKIQLKDADATNDYYAKVQRAVGDGRFSVKLVDASGKAFIDDGHGDHVAVLPGKMKKGNRQMNWVVLHDYLLVTKRDPTNASCRMMEIVLKYQPQAVSQLIKMGLVPSEEGFEFSLGSLFPQDSANEDKAENNESNWADSFDNI